MNKYIILLLVYALTQFAVSSCKTHKIFKAPLKEKEADYLLKKMKESELRFSNLSIRFDVDITFDEKNNSFKGNIKIKKDSIIWISISPLFGIEAFRVILTTDSVKLINKINNTYFLGDFRMINNLFKIPFNFDMIQSLITGNDFSFYENDVFKASIDGELYKLSTVGRRKQKKYAKNQFDQDKVLIQDIWLNPETYKIVKQQWSEIKSNNSKMIFKYDSFCISDDGQAFPSVLNCEISSENNNISLKIKYSKVQVNKPFNFVFNIPESYNPVQ